MSEANLRERFMSAMIDELGGGAEVARKLRRHGLTAIQIAVQILGGPQKAASAIGVNRTTFYGLLGRDVDDWPAGCLRKISELTRIPIETLMLHAPPPEHRGRGGKRKESR